MKKLLLLFAGFAAFQFCTAQSFAKLTINNLQMGFNAAGDQLSDVQTYTNVISTPQNNVTFSVGNLWIGGMDAGGQLHLAAQTYRQFGQNDFWAGALDTITATCPNAQNVFYNKVWKINKTTIDSFRQGLFATIPVAISSWPGNGNAAAGEGHYMAPFADVNNDGLYTPSAGDYPLIRGDQALFWVYNDHLVNQAHTHSGGLPLGVEIHCMAYAVDCADSALSNAVFVHYDIINRSTFTYNATRVALWNNINVGSFSNTKIGCDSMQLHFFMYDSSFAIGALFLNQPMEHAIYYNNDLSVTGNPQNATEFYGYMNGFFTDGTPLTYGGNGYGGSNAATFAFSGDPGSATGWLSSAGVFDPRMVGSTEPFGFLPGAHFALDLVYVAAYDPSHSAYTCVNMLKNRVSAIQSFYNSDQAPCGSNITSVQPVAAAAETIAVFPNPATSSLTLRTNSNEPQPYTIYNTTGQLLQSGFTAGVETQLDVSSLPAGVYFLRTGDTANSAACRFVKTD